MENKSFFMVFVEGERTPTFKHPNRELAEHEAKRLAQLTKKTAYVLASIKSIEVPPEFIIKDVRPSTEQDLPF